MYQGMYVLSPRYSATLYKSVALETLDFEVLWHACWRRRPPLEGGAVVDASVVEVLVHPDSELAVRGADDET